MRGIRSSIVSRSVIFVIGDIDEVGGLEEVDGKVKELMEGSEGLLEVAWDVTGAGVEVDVGEVAEVIFGERGCVERFVAWRMIVEDGIWYKVRKGKVGGIVEGRGERSVKELRGVKELERVRWEKEKREGEVWRRAVGGEGVGLLEEVLGGEVVEKVVGGLVGLAGMLGKEEGVGRGWGGLEEENEKKVVMDWLGKLGKSATPSVAFEVLVGLGVFDRHENLALRDSVFANGFSKEVDEAARVLVEDPVVDKDDGNRLDLRHLTAYAIDSADTVEIDDALSWDEHEGRVWAHIADSTRFLDTDGENEHVDLVIKEALRRASTLYLPTDNYTMFPAQLVKKMSLDCGADSNGGDNRALSFGFHINADGDIDESNVIVRPSLIGRVTRLTYQQVDASLQSDADRCLSFLSEAASRRQEWRRQNGAVMINTPFSNVKVEQAANSKEEPSILLELSPTDTESWKLVSELMIAASTLAGNYFASRNIPGPFRTQEMFEVPDEETLKSIPNNIVRASMAFRYASPSITMSEPRLHASLGVSSYLQITSPIRRSTDTLAHLQLKAHLRNDPLPFTAEEMNIEIGRARVNSQSAIQLERKTKKYWQYEYFRRAGPRQVYPAVVINFIRDSDELARVALKDFGVQVVAKIPPYAGPGSEVAVQITKVDPRSEYLRAEATWMSADDDFLHSQSFEEELNGLSESMFSDVSDNEIVPDTRDKVDVSV